MGPIAGSSHCSLKAYAPTNGDCPLVVVDLGFSSRNPSNGVVSPQHPEGLQRRFGDMADVVVADLLAILSEGKTPLLVLESPLSKLFCKKGNPTFRFTAEQGRGWWYSAGATVALGAVELLDRLYGEERLRGKTVLLAEAFCSHKVEATGDVDDARLIYSRFMATTPEKFITGGVLKPISPLIEGIPPVRVFTHPEPESDGD
jgi:hypothetical protein